MGRLLLGLALGLALAGGAFLLVRHGDSCFGRCGSGTRCADEKGAFHCVAAAAPAPAPPKETHRRRVRHGGAGGAAPEITLRPGDERMASEGDALGRPEHVDLSQPGDDGKSLEQEDLDRVFNPSQGAITRCITDALGDAPLESGKVEIGFKVERSGAVKRVRIAAPQLLLRQGLGRCVRPIVTGLRFPASGGSNVVTYPFQLQ